MPKRVTYIASDRSHVFVEGSATGIPIEQITKAESPAPGNEIPPVKPLAGMAREVFSLGDGEAVLQWPTSIDAAELEDLEEWLALVVKKLKRLKKATGD